MPTNQNTCENCKFWIRKDLETGHCMRYAPPAIHQSIDPEKPAERPVTYQFTPACGDWQKK